MTLAGAPLWTLVLSYLIILFGVGLSIERRMVPDWIINHPLVYVLSLGVFSGVLGVYGASELAFNFGYSFFAYYVGVVVMFAFSPLLLAPLKRICTLYQLNSLADLLSFRFRHPWVGTAVTVALLFSLLPLLALQIQAVADSAQLLRGQTLTPTTLQQSPLAIMFCVGLLGFTLYFGTRLQQSNSRGDGLVGALAFEGLVKLAALLCVGAGALFVVFGGFGGLETWLAENPQIGQLLNVPPRQDSSRALLLTFFAGAVAMPHMFHLLFAGSPPRGALKAASWGVPLYLLLLSLPILPITWAALKLGSDAPVAYSALQVGLGTGSVPLSLIAFVSGLAAASGVIIVSTLALANMCLNHLVLPLQMLTRGHHLDAGHGMHAQLNWLRRLLICLIIMGGYLFYWALANRGSLVDLGMVAFIGTLQLLPGILATIYWPGANRKGLLMGLIGGYLIWFFALLLPLISPAETDFFRYLHLHWLGVDDSARSAATVFSLVVNTTLFLLVSLFTHTSAGEREAAEMCSTDDLNRPARRTLTLNTPEQFANSLAKELGADSARQEVLQALRELQLSELESRPYALRQLRSRLGANLSGMLGPNVAHQIIQRCIPFESDSPADSEDINLIERFLDTSRVPMGGLAADLDNLRRYHRDLLQDLPVGVFSLGHDGEVLMWNEFMERITDSSADGVVGSYLSALNPQWSEVLGHFVSSDRETTHSIAVENTAENIQFPGSRWISLHKANVDSSSRASEDRVIVVEDTTDNRILEQELLHSERLASIGRLAAGIAHEVGNPITAIACLAQNLEYEEDVNAVQETAAEILTQTDRVTRIVESLVNFSHVGSGSRGNAPTRMLPLNLADCVDEAVHLLELDLSAKPVQFSNLVDREQLVLGDSQKLLQVFVNLLGNARDASSEKGLVVIDSTSREQQVTCTVTDHGSGISEQDLKQVFEPFFTTKDPGQGTGLGLSLVYSIMEDLNGHIQLDSPLEDGYSGTCVTLNLSIAEYQEEYL
ncbi:hypothetical protein EYC98_19680 [Halieaceae bacterium IMCC14734]|uniref:histidine kinase n=1 Tax=Candidatus Litorirhabdus singularis TaxID=2518993 RepID=A0ABT3TL92_9GAMM|nr:ATP-binding protein [Candidatus Litorirhabdus singularis]MCX2983088.1 hypothetical protein [Candidatus Litorirhabdus singularis]